MAVVACLVCGGPVLGRLNNRRKYCGLACRYKAKHKATYGKTFVPRPETPRERYLRQCAETSWESY